MTPKIWRWIAVILTGIAVWFSLSGIVMRLADPYRDVSDRLIFASLCYILCLLRLGLSRRGAGGQ